MDDWKKFNETSLLEKEDDYSHLDIEDVTDADYTHSKRICEDFKIKKLSEYHDLYVRSDGLLKADVSRNFQNMYLQICGLDPSPFFEIDVQYSEKLHDLHNYLPFLHEEMKIGKVEKRLANLRNKKEYVIHITNLK